MTRVARDSRGWQEEQGIAGGGRGWQGVVGDRDNKARQGKAADGIVLEGSL